MLDAAGNAALLRDVNNGPAHGLADGLAGGSGVPDSDLPGHVPSAVATGDGHRRGAPFPAGGGVECCVFPNAWNLPMSTT